MRILKIIYGRVIKTPTMNKSIFKLFFKNHELDSDSNLR